MSIVCIVSTAWRPPYQPPKYAKLSLVTQRPNFEDDYRTRADIEVISDTHRVNTNPEVKMNGSIGFRHNSGGD